MKYLGYAGHGGGYVLRAKAEHGEYLAYCARLWRAGNYCNKQDGEQQAKEVEKRIERLKNG